jgi:peptidoglycan/LPS O-acetylase OafA/YrhL
MRRTVYDRIISERRRFSASFLTQTSLDPQPERLGSLDESANLDILRAAAVIAVYVNHACYTLGAYGTKWFSPATLGRAGVLFFFVHTSLVLMLSLRRSATNGRVHALVFYVRRAFRIYPLSILCVLACLMFHIPQAPWESLPHVTTLDIASNLLLIQNLTGSSSICSPMWSLHSR